MSFVTLDKQPKPPRQPATAVPTRAGRSARALPTVNLLSPSIQERMAVVRLRQRFIAGGLVLAVLVGGVWMMQTQRLNSAEDKLAAEQSMTPALQQQVDALAPVATYYAAVDARKLTASQAMAAEVLFSKALADLNRRTPDGMKIGSMAVTLTPTIVSSVSPPQSPLAVAGIDANGKDVTGNATATAPAAAGAGAGGTTTGQNSAARAALSTADSPGTTATGDEADAKDAAAKPAAAPLVDAVSCARPDPFNPSPIIGCVTLSGTASSRAVVGEFINSLKSSDLYADPFVTTTSMNGALGEESVVYSGSVGLTGKAVSGRYADLSWLSDPKVLAKAEQMIRSGETASAKLAVKAKRDAAVQKAKEEAEAKAAEAAEAAAQAAAEAEAAKQIQDAAQAAAEAAALAQANRNGGTS